MAMIAYDCPQASRTKVGGGSIQQTLDYMYPDNYKVNSPAGKDLLVATETIARPRIGGFIPSVMKGVVNGASIVGPLAFVAAKRLMNNTRRRRGGGRKEDWAQNREIAKKELERYGKPAASNIQKYAGLKRKLGNKKFNSRQVMGDIEQFMEAYIQRKKEKEQEKKVKGIRKLTRKAAKAPEKRVHLFFNNEGKIIQRKENTVALPPVPGTRPGINLGRVNVREEVDIDVEKTPEGFPNTLPVRTPENKTPEGFPSFLPVRTPENVNEKPYTMANIRREAMANVEAARKASKTKRTYTKKATGNEWRSLQNRARKVLSEYGKPKASNVTRYASSLRGKASELNPNTLLSEFKTKTLKAANNTKKRLGNKTNKRAVYKANQTAARNFLASQGKAPSGRNVMRFTALSRKKNKNNASRVAYNTFLRNYQTRKNGRKGILKTIPE